MRKMAGSHEKKSTPNPNYDPNQVNIPPAIALYNGESDFDITKAVASFKAMLELNAKGVAHLDLNTENCLIYQDEKGQTKANLIDFGNAADSSVNYNFESQVAVFDMVRPFVFPAYVNALQKAKEEFDKAHQLKSYIYLAGFLIAGGCTIYGFGFTSYFLWQYVRSTLSSAIIAECRARLDMQDLGYSKYLDANVCTQGELFRWKALITLGYALINLYTLINLYLSVPNLKLTSTLTDLLKHLKNIHSLDEFSASIINNCITPLTTTILNTLNNPANLYEQYNAAAIWCANSANLLALDKTLAEVTYLYSHLTDTVASLANTVERCFPAEHLLIKTDLLYKHNPTLLFKCAATKAKEFIFGKTNENEPDVNSAPRANRTFFRR